MKAIFTFSALILISISHAAAQTPTADEAIRHIVSEQAAAWNSGDGAKFSRHVSPDVSFTNLFGMVMYGGEAFSDQTTHFITFKTAS